MFGEGEHYHRDFTAHEEDADGWVNAMTFSGDPYQDVDNVVRGVQIGNVSEAMGHPAGIGHEFYHDDLADLRRLWLLVHLDARRGLSNALGDLLQTVRAARSFVEVGCGSHTPASCRPPTSRRAMFRNEPTKVVMFGETCSVLSMLGSTLVDTFSITLPMVSNFES